MPEDGKELIKKLGRNYREEPFFWKPRLISLPRSWIENSPTDKNYVLMPYWICFTNLELTEDEIYALIPQKLKKRIKVVTREITPEILSNTIRQIKGQKLYYFEKNIGVKINNYYYKNLKHFDKIRRTGGEVCLTPAPLPQKIPMPFEGRI